MLIEERDKLRIRRVEENAKEKITAIARDVNGMFDLLRNDFDIFHPKFAAVFEALNDYEFPAHQISLVDRGSETPNIYRLVLTRIRHVRFTVLFGHFPLVFTHIAVVFAKCLGLTRRRRILAACLTLYLPNFVMSKSLVLFTRFLFPTHFGFTCLIFSATFQRSVPSDMAEERERKLGKLFFDRASLWR